MELGKYSKANIYVSYLQRQWNISKNNTLLSHTAVTGQLKFTITDNPSFWKEVALAEKKRESKLIYEHVPEGL